MTINILAPLTRAEEVEPLADAGADEFYSGIVPEKWAEKYATIGSLNKKHMLAAQFKSLEELEKAVGMAHDRGKPVYLAINELYYTSEQTAQILELIEKTKKIGIDAYIMADPALLTAVKGQDLEIHISIGGAVFNSGTAEFYRELGAKRIIIPRHYRLEEARELAKKTKGLGLECIITKGRAVNVCGLCAYHHFDENAPESKGFGLACFTQWACEIIEGDGNLAKKRAIMGRLRPRWDIGNSCGACAMRRLEEWGYSSFKIPGRESATSSKIKDVAFLDRVRKLAREERPFEDYIREVKKEYAMAYSTRCDSLKCHWAYERSRDFK